MNVHHGHFPPPVGFYYTTLEYLHSQGLELDKCFYEFNFEHHKSQRMPKCIDGNIPWEFYRSLSNHPPREFVAKLKDARIVGEHGSIISSSNHLIWDTSIQYGAFGTVEPKNHPIFNKWDINDNPITTSEKVAALTFCANQYYYHWMFDILPKIHLLGISGVEIDKYIINRNGPKKRFQEESLAMMGITPERIIEVESDHFHLVANELFITSLSGHSGQMPKWTCDFLRSIFLKEDNKQKQNSVKRLYISRKDAAHRKVSNDKEVQWLLEGYGFKTVELDSLSIQEQAHLFQNADVIVGAHGGGLTNLVFCKPNTKVIEIFSPNWVVPLYWVLSNHLNLDYYFMLGVGNRPPLYKEVAGCFYDIKVDTSILEKTLQLSGIFKY
jgi:hypothetical protein